MNNNIKQLADQALASTQWTVVKSLSTVQVNKELELDAFAKLLLDDCMNLCDQVSLEQNKIFLDDTFMFVMFFTNDLFFQK
mgnify:CR=1 FL=1